MGVKNTAAMSVWICFCVRSVDIFPPKKGGEKKEATAYISCIELQQITCYDCVCVCVYLHSGWGLRLERALSFAEGRSML